MPSKYHNRITIDIEHTDCTGVVYHAKYLNFLESARSQILRTVCEKHHLNLQELYLNDGFFVVHNVNIKYMKPMRLGDLGDVISQVECISAVRSRWHQSIISLCGQGHFIDATVDCVFVDLNLRPSKLPEALAMSLAEEMEWTG